VSVRLPQTFLRVDAVHSREAPAKKQAREPTHQLTYQQVRHNSNFILSFKSNLVCDMPADTNTTFKGSQNTNGQNSPVDIDTFFQSGPLQVQNLSPNFPLREKVDRCCPLATSLVQIDTGSYPDKNRVKAHEPAFKRYTGTVLQSGETAGKTAGTTEPSGVFFKLTGLLDANALVCGSYEKPSDPAPLCDAEDDPASGTSIASSAKPPASASSASGESTFATSSASTELTNILEQISHDATAPPQDWVGGGEAGALVGVEDYRTELRNSELGNMVAKTESPHNTAFVDSLASCLTSKLVSDSVCPHFPRVYGVYNGVAAKHHVEFTEEYYDHKHSQEFQKGVSMNKWQMVPQPPLERVPDSELDSDNDEGSGREEQEDNDDEDDEDDDSQSECSVCTNDSTNEHIPRDSLVPVTLGDIGTLEKELDTTTTTTTTTPMHMHTNGAHNKNNNNNNNGESSMSSTTDLLADDTFLVQLDTLKAPLRLPADQDEIDQQYFLQMHDAPVQVVAMEAFDTVFETTIRAEFRELRRCEMLVARERHSGCLFDEREDDEEGEPDSGTTEEGHHTGDAASTVAGTASPETAPLPKHTRQAAYHWLSIYKRRRFERKWIAILAQVCMALVAMQHAYDMVHNDLHGHNILLAPTELTHLRYEVHGDTFHVPTYGYIVKLIDMGRTTFQLENELYMGDVYHPRGEAGEQYSYIHHHTGLVSSPEQRAKAAADKEVLLPNPSFDLARLACSLIDEFYQGADLFRGMYSADSVAIPDEANVGEVACTAHNQTPTDDLHPRLYKNHLFQGQPPTVSPFYNMLCEWITDSGNKPINRFDNFDLYKQIARRMRRCLPEHQLHRPHFAQYKIVPGHESVIDTSTMSPLYKLTGPTPTYTERMPHDIERPAYTADNPFFDDDSDGMDDGDEDAFGDEFDFGEEDQPDFMEELLKGFAGAAAGTEPRDGGGSNMEAADGEAIPNPFAASLIDMIGKMGGGCNREGGGDLASGLEEIVQQFQTDGGSGSGNSTPHLESDMIHMLTTMMGAAAESTGQQGENDSTTCFGTAASTAQQHQASSPASVPQVEQMQKMLECLVGEISALPDTDADHDNDAAEDEQCCDEHSKPST